MYFIMWCLWLHILTIKNFMRACQSSDTGSRQSDHSSSVLASARCRFALCCLSTVNKKSAWCHFATSCVYSLPINSFVAIIIIINHVSVLSFIFVQNITYNCSRFLGRFNTVWMWDMRNYRAVLMLKRFHVLTQYTTRQYYNVGLNGPFHRLIWEVLRWLIVKYVGGLNSNIGEGHCTLDLTARWLYMCFICHLWTLLLCLTFLVTCQHCLLQTWNSNHYQSTS